MMSEMIRFWEEGLLFCDGWYLYTNGKGDYSIISKKSAMKKMEDYQRYQVSQDTGRAGLAPDIAFSHRGFQKIDGKYVYVGKEIDNLATSPVREIPEILSIPYKVGEFSITYIAEDAFYEESNIHRLILHDRIKAIEHNAFADCINLSQIDNASEWLTIGKNAFKNTKIYNIEPIHYLNHVLLKVEPSYSGKVIVKEGIHSISDNAFENCKEITEVILPQTVKKIGANVFKNCSNLEVIHLPEQMDFLGEGAFYGCTKLNNVVIPRGVQFIRQRTFENCESLSKIQIPYGIRYICYDAFRNTAYMNTFNESTETELYLNDWLIRYKYDPKRVLNVRPGTIGIASMDWSDNKALASVVFPEGLKYIGSDAFRMPYLSMIKLPQSLLTICHAAFRHTHISEIKIPSSVKKIDKWTFQNCPNLKNIYILGKDTEVCWPAITGTNAKTIYGYIGSSAHEYYKKYGEQYNIQFKNINNLQKGIL